MSLGLTLAQTKENCSSIALEFLLRLKMSEAQDKTMTHSPEVHSSENLDMVFLISSYKSSLSAHSH